MQFHRLRPLCLSVTYKASSVETCLDECVRDALLLPGSTVKVSYFHGDALKLS